MVSAEVRQRLLDLRSSQAAVRASEAGVRAGDQLVRVDDRPIASFADLVDVVTGSKGNTLRLELRRGGETLVIEDGRHRIEGRSMAEGGSSLVEHETE